MEMTVELFDSIINTSQDCVFWKDNERRFLGVNQAFLDFYGFESADVLIGKTDEDMGWHSDPEPFKHDELLVLSGRSTYKVQGKCFIRGEERDIIASKRPLYEGDKIVGLVGSFVDITDVLRRKNGADSSQIVYTRERLRKFSFFDHLIDEISLDEILDPLTGVLSRAYSIKFVRALIADKTPFSFTILDLDNFKFINDSYGHSAGDTVLKTVTMELAEAANGFGLVGRFGGDELLLIDLKNTDRDSKIDFFEKLYTNSSALRIKVRFDNGSSLITGTSGCATFPNDSDNFTDLFGIVDKMLYLGKSRGRNCYTIYDESEHKNVEISKIAKYGVFSAMHRLRLDTENAVGFENKMKTVMPLLADILQVRDMYYVLETGRMKAVNDTSFDGDVRDIANLMTEDVFSENTLERVEKDSPIFYDTLLKNGFESAMVVRIRKSDTVYGYLICAVERSSRIWQENECAILYYLAGLLAE
ncbi:MAG: GGDEF domain-containing protein [Lachnospiraceae bacterium]|nr:GGDEF domain-containing protein [Lachnospiraceae bacterium]